MSKVKNLYTDSWIPVIVDRRFGYVSAEDALQHSDRIERIVGATPLETAGLYRFLIAYHLCPEPSRLSLCDPIFPFMQASFPLYEKTSIAYLTPDLPTGANSIHWRHNCVEGSAFFCSGCIARALVALPSHTTMGGRGQGGQGLSPSINGAPPIYWIPIGDCLGDTLRACIHLGHQSGWLPWTRIADTYLKFEQVDVLHGIMFLPRRIHVFWLEEEFTCTRCGQPGSLGAKEMTYSMGDKYTGKEWRDPFVMYRKKGNAVRGYGVRSEWEAFCKGLWADREIEKPSIQAEGGSRWLALGVVTDQARYDDAFECIVDAKDLLTK